MEARPQPREELGLDPSDWAELARLGHRAVDDMATWLRTVRERPAWRSPPPEVRERLDEGLPIQGQGAERAYTDFVRDVLPYPLGNVHPRFWGWVCGTGSPSGMVYELLAAAMNSSLGAFDQSAVLVEQRVLAWLKEMLRFPAGASGVLTSGGSMANFIGLAVARQATLGEEIRKHGLIDLRARPMVYASSETHSSVQRALEMLGLGSDSLRRVAVGDDYRVDIAAMQEAIEQDRWAGLRPIAIVGNAGSVNTGSIDDLSALAYLARREKLWFHVDGAIGAPAMICEELAPKLGGLELADSLAFDLHKWMHVPYEAGCVLVRDAELHRATFSLTPPYLERSERGILPGGTTFSDYGPQLSRGFRALKVWMLLKEHGVARYAELIRRNVAQAKSLAESIDREAHLERLAPVALDIVCFRYVGAQRVPAELDALNRELLLRLQESGTCVPSSTTLRGRFALRICITNHRTRDEDLELLVREAVRIGDQISKEREFDGASSRA